MPRRGVAEVPDGEYVYSDFEVRNLVGLVETRMAGSRSECACLISVHLRVLMDEVEG